MKSSALFLVLVLLAAPAWAGESELPNTPRPLDIHALTGARVVDEPGHVIESGTVLIRDGRIEAVGSGIEVPPDARVWDLSGKTIYAGFLDPFTSVGLPQEKAAGGRSRSGTGRGENKETPRGPAHDLPLVHAETVAADLIQVEEKTLESWRGAGFTAVVTASPSGIFRGSAALLNLGDGGARENLARQEVAQSLGLDHSSRRSNQYPASAMGAVATMRQTLLDAQHYRIAWSAYRSQPAKSRRPEANRALAALGHVVGRNELAIVDSDDLLGLVRAAGVVKEFDLDAVLVGSGEEHRHVDWVRDTGLAVILPVNFPDPPEVGDEGPALDVSTDSLKDWYRAPETAHLLHRAGVPFAFTAHQLERPGEIHGKIREAVKRGLDPDAALQALTVTPARLTGVDDLLGTIAAGKLANLTITDGDLLAENTKVVEVWIDGRRYENHSKKKGDKPDKKTGNDDAKKKRDKGKVKDKDEEAEPVVIPWAPPPGPLDTPDTILVRGATVWTQGPQGILENADLLVSDGTIEKVGQGLEAPRGAHVVQADGRHVTPGLIDAHSHSATAEAVNEGTRAVTSEVRVSDVMNPDSPTLYRLLAGGLTTAHVLHGSANPIGGQSAHIKIVLGATPASLQVDGAPPSIKFALGENVKQANWGDEYTTRYPQTRMGVEQVLRQSFLAARDYRDAWARYDADDPSQVPPRRNLQLDALVEILEGTRLLHCHSYRQDEILMLLNVADEFGFRIAALQHVLEGYKVAPEIAERSVGASTFSDWWAYKFEVYDAIPFNGALMHEAGVLVSFNSDSSELARRLNLEAAKAVKYGGLSPEDALNFVTLNPAKQLGLDERLGSLEPGKEADFVLWSGDPLSTRTVADQTWVKGALYFDRAQDPERNEAMSAERAALIAAARAAEKKGGKGGKNGKKRDKPGQEVTR